MRQILRSCPWKNQIDFNWNVLFTVIAWLESMNRLESRFLVNWTRLVSRGEKWWLDSSHVFSKIDWNRFESQSSQNYFFKISEFLMDKPATFPHKELNIFWLSDDQDWWKFSACLSSRVMLYFKDQVSPTWKEEDLRLCFHWGVSATQYNEFMPSLCIVAVGLMLWPRVFSRYQ